MLRSYQKIHTPAHAAIRVNLANARPYSRLSRPHSCDARLMPKHPPYTVNLNFGRSRPHFRISPRRSAALSTLYRYIVPIWRRSQVFAHPQSVLFHTVLTLSPSFSIHFPSFSVYIFVDFRLAIISSARK